MATKSLTSYSSDGIIEQEVFWDTDLKKIQVIHYINLPFDSNAILSKWRRYQVSKILLNLIT